MMILFRTSLHYVILVLSPCTHEEADICLLLHAKHAELCGHFKVLIWTVDIDVIALAICSSTTVFGEIFEQVLFSYNSNDQQSNENKTYSKISHVIERIDQVTSLYLTC